MDIPKNPMQTAWCMCALIYIAKALAFKYKLSSTYVYATQKERETQTYENIIITTSTNQTC